MDSMRQQKAASQILRDLSEVFQKNASSWFHGTLLTINHVNVSPDLGLARIFYTVLPESKKAETQARLDQHKSEIRKHLGNLMGKRVRIIPEIAFFYDEQEVQAQKMDQLIASLNIPKNGPEE
jgi:ribosome-binding factor A